MSSQVLPAFKGSNLGVESTQLLAYRIITFFFGGKIAMMSAGGSAEAAARVILAPIRVGSGFSVVYRNSDQLRRSRSPICQRRPVGVRAGDERFSNRAAVPSVWLEP